MICVYPADCTDFSTNGKGTIEPTSAQVADLLGHKDARMVETTVETLQNSIDLYARTRQINAIIKVDTEQ